MSPRRTKKAAGEADRTVLKAVEAPYYEVDLAGRFTYVTEALGRIFGIPPGSLIGVDNRDMMSPASARAVLREFNAVFRTGLTREIEEIEVKWKDDPPGSSP